MTLHDWSVIDDGAFHHFHQAWITSLCRLLNRGGLPPGYGAHAERAIDVGEPDVLTSEAADLPADDRGGVDTMTIDAVTTAVVAEAKTDRYVRKQDRLVVRGRDRRVVAVVELVSRGNKDSRYRFERFIEKSVEYIEQGAHLCVVDVHAPHAFDPRGMLDAVWDRVAGEASSLLGRSAGTICVGSTLRLFAEPLTVGDSIPDIPLFLTADRFVPLPLGEGYADAWETMPPDEQTELDATLA